MKPIIIAIVVYVQLGGCISAPNGCDTNTSTGGAATGEYANEEILLRKANDVELDAVTRWASLASLMRNLKSNDKKAWQLLEQQEGSDQQERLYESAASILFNEFGQKAECDDERLFYAKYAFNRKRYAEALGHLDVISTNRNDYPDALYLRSLCHEGVAKAKGKNKKTYAHTAIAKINGYIAIIEQLNPNRYDKWSQAQLNDHAMRMKIVVIDLVALHLKDKTRVGELVRRFEARHGINSSFKQTLMRYKQ